MTSLTRYMWGSPGVSQANCSSPAEKQRRAKGLPQRSQRAGESKAPGKLMESRRRLNLRTLNINSEERLLHERLPYK